MIYYEKAADYFGTCTEMDEKITKVQQVIDALLTLSLTAVENEIYEEYQLSDGQTTIRARYRGLSAILAAIKGYESIKQLYINQRQGRTMTMVDGINLPGRCY